MRLLTSSPILLNFVLFLSLLSTDEEAEEAAAAESNALSAGGRKVGDQHMAHSPSVGGAGAAPRGSAVGKPLVQGSSSLTQLASPSAAAARLAAAQAAAAAEAAAQAAAAAAAAEDDDDYEYEEFNPYLFIKMLPAYHTVAPKHPHIALSKKPKKAPEVNLVLDLDETLVHCSVDPIDDADVTFPVSFNGCNYQVYVRKRPHLDKFFASIAGKFEVTIFTASQQVYAERLLNILDPEGIYIQNRLYRDSCLNVDGNYLKDLNVLGRDLSKTVLVDNSPHAFGYQLDNGIPIESWFDDKTDTELLKLSAFVHQLIGKDDVRPVVREKFKVHKLVEEASRRIPPPAQAPPMH
jgi:CTD small phosphatase-like protein 2